MRNEEEIKAMFKWVEDHPELGKVDICIPNAGMSYKSTLLEGMNNFLKKYHCLHLLCNSVHLKLKKNVGTMDEWRTMLDVNVLSLQLCTQLAIKSMLKVLLSLSLLFFVKTHEPFLQTSRAEEK